MDSHINTERLNLRYVANDDVDAIQCCILDPRIYKMVGRISPEQPRKATEDWITTHPNGRKANTDHVYAICLERKFIGLIGLHRATIAEPFELGFWMSPKAWGKGYITEAGKALLSSLDKKACSQRTISGYFLDNPASGLVLKKLGYIKTGNGKMHCAGRNKVLPHVTVERPSVK